MDFLILIKNGCDNLTATASPSVDSLGLRMVLSLATIMLVWFGVQEALASAQGGPGFNVGKFLSFFLLITFAYSFVKFYDGSIPGIGYSLKGFVSGGTSSLVDYIGNDSTQEVQNTIRTALAQVGNLSPSFTEPYKLLCTYTVQVILSILTALKQKQELHNSSPSAGGWNVPEAGSCHDCPKRTGHNTLLFEGIAAQHDSCSDPGCYSAKVDAHVKQTVAAKPKLVQITTAYCKPAEGSPVVPRNQYVEIRQEKPKNKYQQDAPEYKTCKFTTEAIVADGSEKGEIRKVCANPDCPVHHPKKQQRRADPDSATKAAQEKQRRDEAQAQATGLRVLKAIGDAVPVRLMKRDLLFVVSRLSAMLDERRLSVLIRQHGIGKSNDAAPAKLLAAFLPKAEENKLGRILVETAILLSMHNQTDAAKILRDAAHAYKVDVDAISATVKQEFASKEKAKGAKKAAPNTPVKAQSKPAKKAAAA